MLSPFAHIFLEPKLYLTGDDDRFFWLALKNACLGMGITYPNPSVGSVLVKNGEVISQGFTEPAGGRHAEKCAIHNAQNNTIGSTLYVTLEPCCHVGRTPPCTNAIIESGIKRVIYGALDPNPKVLGRGIAQLIDAGIEVSEINNLNLRKMALAQLKPFKTWIEKKRPYIVLKVATSKDNKIAAGMGHKSKITGFEADIVVHQLRGIVDAIMIGANTARIDNPLLTSRLGFKRHNKQPTRIVLSSDLNLDENLNIFNKEAKTLVITGEISDSAHQEKLQTQNMSVISSQLHENKIDLSCAFKRLADLGYTSLLVEAGKTLFHTMIASGFVDEIWWFKSPNEIGNFGLALDIYPKDLLQIGYSIQSNYKLGYDELILFLRSN